MKKSILILTVVLLFCFCCGCGAEKAKVDISDGGDLTAADPAEAGGEAAETIEAETAEPGLEYVTLAYKGNTAKMAVKAVFPGEENLLSVQLVGSGYAFDGVFPMENNKLVLPFVADVVVNGTTFSWKGASFGSGELTYSYDTGDMPEKIVLYSIDNEAVKFTVDAAPYITESPAAAEPETEVKAEDAAEAAAREELEALAGKWFGRGQSQGGGDEIFIKVTLEPDGTGRYRFRQGDYAESYPFTLSVEGSGFEADIPSDNELNILAIGGNYEFDGDVLSLHIRTEFAGGRIFAYDAACARLTEVTDEPFTMVTSKFSVNGLYTGEWMDGMPYGEGTMTMQETNDRWDFGDTLWSEDWVAGLIEGYGEWRSAVDGAYDGNFVAGLKEGYGRMWFSNGTVYDGRWSEGRFLG